MASTFDHEVRVDVAEDARGVVAGVLVGGVRGVALLPEELGGAQEQRGAAAPSGPRWPTG